MARRVQSSSRALLFGSSMGPAALARGRPAIKANGVLVPRLDGFRSAPISRGSSSCKERRVLPLERLGHAGTQALRYGSGCSIGEDVFLRVLESIEDALRHRCCSGFRYFEA